MSLMTYINGVPLFSTLQEALQWGSNRNLTGHHNHSYQGQTGYMGGSNHNNAVTQNTPSAPISNTVSSSGGGGGGGY